MKRRLRDTSKSRFAEDRDADRFSALVALHLFEQGDSRELAYLVADGAELPEPVQAILGRIVSRAGPEALQKIASIIRGPGAKPAAYNLSDQLCVAIAIAYEKELAKEAERQEKLTRKERDAEKLRPKLGFDEKHRRQMAPHEQAADNVRRLKPFDRLNWDVSSILRAKALGNTVIQARKEREAQEREEHARTVADTRTSAITTSRSKRSPNRK